MLLGILVLVGWLLDITALKRVLPGLVVMAPSTAVGLMLVGAALLASARGQDGVMGQVVAGAAAVIGLLTLVEYVAGVSLGIDRILFPDSVEPIGIFPAGRMPPVSALNLLLTGSALLLYQRRAYGLSQFLSVVALLVALLALFGYAYGASHFFEIVPYASVALHTAVAFIILSLGMLALPADSGPMVFVVDAGEGGMLARRLLPVAVAGPFLLGGLILLGQQLGQYDTEFGLALFALANVIVFTVLVWRNAALLAKRDAERQQNEVALRRLNEELEQRVKQRTVELEAANRELEAFAYSVSHDLRAPLRAVSGFARILLEDFPLEGEAADYLRLIDENGQQMGRLIDDLLAFSRLSHQPLSKRTVRPADIARQCWKEVGGEEEERPVELVIDDLPPAEADPALLKQVYLNLLSNALKFTRRREVARIEVGYEQVEGETVYFVRDNGAGFDMRYAANLFGVFQRMHPAEEYEGTGVGLAIVQRVVHRHGGRVWAESEVDKGTTIYFTL
jgi:signal transduction histidine kinase